MEEQYAICRVAISPMRATPADQAEIVSQLLFGDEVLLLEQTERWWKVQNLYDGYQGWIDFKQVSLVPDIAPSRYLAPPAVANTLVAGDGSRYYLAAGSNLPAYQEGYCQIGNTRFQVDFSPLDSQDQAMVHRIPELALFFQHAPYLWGGRTLFGIDCSGFVQIVFKMAGIPLKRDASLQADQGIAVDFLPECIAGDVAFFDNEEGRITHVGILLSNDKVIHASGKVRIDPIDDQGIYNAELQRYTHKLRIIRRFTA